MNWINNARIIAIFAVVFLHVAAEVLLINDIGSEYWWYANVFDSAVRWCVPVFVMLSGALLLDSSKEESISAFYKKRLSRIFIPLVFWSVLYSVWFMLRKDNFMFAEVVSRLLAGKPYFHMWFLFMIIGLYLFTPFFRKIVANSTRRDLKLLVLIMFILSSISFGYRKLFSNEPALFINWFLLYIPYYFLGYLIRTDDRKPTLKLLISVFILSVLITCLGCYFLALNKDLKTGLYFYGNLSISVVPMSISIMYMLKHLNKAMIGKNITAKLSALTLGVYLIHPLILDLFKDTVHILFYIHPLISVFSVASFIFIFSVVFSWIINQIPYLKRTI
jgi:surface polysaccharide O-acyltransferase-like enzyme